MQIDVLDHGFVRLDGSMADDLSVVNSARVSFGKRKEVMDKSDEGLINFLMRERHGTPFEHNAFRFHISCPIFVAREWFRHRIGSFNEFSGRYTEMPEKFYIPAPENVRSQVGKPGNYHFEPISDQKSVEKYRASLIFMSNDAFDNYKLSLDDGVAKEIARLFLPVNWYTEFYWTVNSRALMNFVSLRNEDSALWEIRQYAIAVERIFSEKMPISASTFVKHGRFAP